MRKALIGSGNIVVNVIEVDDGSDWTPPDGLTLVDDGDGAMIGGTYDPDTETFTPPVPPDPPAPVTPPPTGEQFAALQAAVATLAAQALTTTGGA